MQFWRETDEKACIPHYKGFPRKTDNGTDANYSEVMHGYTLEGGCDPGRPYNNDLILFEPPPVIGQDGFGGTVVGAIKDPLAKANKVSTGGIWSYIPIPKDKDKETETIPADPEYT
jgi:hypothetical protein